MAASMKHVVRCQRKLIQICINTYCHTYQRCAVSRRHFYSTSCALKQKSDDIDSNYNDFFGLDLIVPKDERPSCDTVPPGDSAGDSIPKQKINVEESDASESEPRVTILQEKFGTVRIDPPRVDLINKKSRKQGRRRHSATDSEYSLGKSKFNYRNIANDSRSSVEDVNQVVTSSKSDTTGSFKTEEEQSIFDREYFQYDGVFSESVNSGTSANKADVDVGAELESSQYSCVESYSKSHIRKQSDLIDRTSQTVDTIPKQIAENGAGMSFYTNEQSRQSVDLDLHEVDRQYFGTMKDSQTSHQFKTEIDTECTQDENTVSENLTDFTRRPLSEAAVFSNKSETLSQKIDLDLDEVDQQYFGVSSEKQDLFDHSEFSSPNLSAEGIDIPSVQHKEKEILLTDKIDTAYHQSASKLILSSASQENSASQEENHSLPLQYQERTSPDSSDLHEEINPLALEKQENNPDQELFDSFKHHFADTSEERLELQKIQQQINIEKEERSHSLRTNVKEEKPSLTSLKHYKRSKQTKTEGTALEVAKKIRSEVQKNARSSILGDFRPKQVDSFGFRILKNQVPDFKYVPQAEIVDLLYEGIVYNDNDIVALNKPYGLPTLGSGAATSSVVGLLDKLVKKVDRELEKLHLIHRLDKETTGVLLLAKTPAMAWQLSEAFRKREAVKTYLAITRGIPKHTSGVINIPIEKAKASDGKFISVLRPHNDGNLRLAGKVRQGGSEAVTEYTVLSTGGNCALLECSTKTGLTHQVRVHLASGMNCAILGDHKYSCLGKMAPQKLPSEMLHRLKIRQSKVRHLAMHLHARKVVLPEIVDGANIVISAPIPRHFKENLKSLKLKL